MILKMTFKEFECKLDEESLIIKNYLINGIDIKKSEFFEISKKEL